MFATDSKTKAFQAAVAADKLRDVKEMLASGVSVDSADYFKVRSIHIASAKGYLDMVNLLIEHGCDVNAQADCPPVSEQQRTMEEFVEPEEAERLASIASQRYVEFVRYNESNFGITPLHAAALHGHLPVAKALVSANANIHSEDNMKETPLFPAMSRGSEQIATFLIENGAVVNVTSLDGSTPLHRAAERGNVDAAELLLQHEAAINATNVKGFTPLHVSVLSRQPAVSEFLINSGADVNAIDNDGRTPLFAGAKCGCPAETARLLLVKGASVDATDVVGRTPLHLAAENGYTDIVYLLLQNKADINATDDLMWTPLHYATYAGNFDIVNCLVGMGAVVNVRTDKQVTPLHFAADHWGVGVVRTLLVYGAEVNAADHMNWTALHYAADERSPRRISGQRAVEMQQLKLHTMKALIEYKADVNTRGSTDETPLHVAAKYGDRMGVKYLLEKGAYYDGKTSCYFGSSSPAVLDLTAISMSVSINTLLVATANLFKAVKKADCAEIENCIKEGAPVNSRSTKHETPLMYACWKGHLSVVSVLLANGADPNLSNSSGDTPLHFAAKLGHLEMVYILLQHGAVFNATTKTGNKTPLNFAQEEKREIVVDLLEMIERMFIRVSMVDNTVINELNELKKIDYVKFRAIGNCKNLAKETLRQIASNNECDDLCKLLRDM